MTRLQSEIALLREYRTRLVADVVTGRLDVRGVARNLPAEAEPTVVGPEDEDAAEVAEVAEGLDDST